MELFTGGAPTCQASSPSGKRFPMSKMRQRGLFSINRFSITAGKNSLVDKTADLVSVIARLVRILQNPRGASWHNYCKIRVENSVRLAAPTPEVVHPNHSA